MKYKNKHLSLSSPGFALVATISVMVLLVMIALAMLSLSTIEIRQSRQANYQAVAKANARMALMIAIGELQKYAGPDQRVTANASILDADPNTPLVDGVANPNLLGVWRNITEEGHFMIGKDNSAGGGESVYGTRDYYKDLRFSNLKYKNWRDHLRLTWLASFKGDKKKAHQFVLSDADKSVIALVGRGTLGKEMDLARFNREKLLVQKIEILKNGQADGAYAWAVIDNNQKSAMILGNPKTSDALKLASAQRDQYAGLASSDSHYADYKNIDADIRSAGKEIISYKNTSLRSSKSSELSAALGRDFNHFTVIATGLFTNPVLGGFKKDLTPLLFGDPKLSTIHFESPSSTTAQNPFSSSYPIIPGPRHLSHGPSFDALRSWGRQKYVSGLVLGKVKAESKVPSTVLRRRPFDDTQGWAMNKNDGYTFVAKEWAAKVPKLMPVMTDVRFHYYFGLKDNSPSTSLRTHLIPRVCLWNPYNVTMTTPEMVVLMPNFFWTGGSFKLFLSNAETERVKAVLSSDAILQTHWQGQLHYWCRTTGDINNVNAPSSIFLNSRFLAFTLEPTQMQPGECLVFSPSPRSGETAGGITIGKYDLKNIANNILSASSPQGEDHFYSDNMGLPYFVYRVEKRDSDGNVVVNEDGNPVMETKTYRFTRDQMSKIRLSEVYKYEPWGLAYENFIFALKSTNGHVLLNKTASDISNSSDYPTLQLINGSNAGSRTYDFWYYSWWWGDSNNASGGTFGKLQTFAQNPTKDAPATHQIGAKLLWLDESHAEGNDPPLRVKRWKDSNHIAYNPAIIANWNVRSQLTTRSPASICSDEWYTTSLGAWMQSFAPPSPCSAYDLPTMDSNGNFAKFPFGAASDFPGLQSAVLFELPNPNYGALSLAALRHAELSPYSWTPSYIIGSSLVDLHAPLDATAYPSATQELSNTNLSTQWDVLIGERSMGYGAASYSLPVSDGLLQTGAKFAEKVKINGKELSTDNEVLAYDIVYETNQSLWDEFFISGLKLNTLGTGFVPSALDQDNLWNSRYLQNVDTMVSSKSLNDMLSAGDGLSFAFWNAAYILKNKAAFNINSTSIPAWSAFLSGIRNVKRPLLDGSFSGGNGESVFSRTSKPKASVKTSSANPSNSSAWGGGRSLTDDEIHTLASTIVQEVKLRGPFISLSDMVNRRLMPLNSGHPDPQSQRGAIEAAIVKADLNANYHVGKWKRTVNAVNDNNKSEFKLNYDDYLDLSKAWGVPGFLTQADILEPLAPSMTVRGDTFTIRCYGEARDGEKIKARVYLEAVVVRMPDYMEANILGTSSKTGNLPTDPAQKIDYATGEVSDGNLTNINKNFGRRFKILSFRWLSPSEI